MRLGLIALIATACGGRSSLGVLVLDDAEAPADGASAGETSVTPRALQVAAGAAHTCALLSSRAVWCWGDNRYGQLGDGSTTGHNTPINVVSLGVGASAISAGAWHTCALLSRGAIRCWGDNIYGQLGDGTTVQRHTPVDVVSLGGTATSISAGGDHTCAVLSSGAIRCWGANPGGQLGDGTTVQRRTPGDVVALGGSPTLVSAGIGYTCAGLSSGGVRCWGFNDHGQLGDGTTVNRATPVDVVSLGGSPTLVSAGGYHTCAVLSSGAVRCWGSWWGGVLDPTNKTPTPVDVSVGGFATQVSAGGAHTCGLLTSGAIRCWGDNTYGQLGDGTTNTTSSPTPVTVVGLP